jgi:hypothetical protein
MEVTIKNISEGHILAIVTTTKGFVYASTYADGHKPACELTAEDIKADWKEDRKSFKPYNTSSGGYC